jgi:hypothetical protein
MLLGLEFGLEPLTTLTTLLALVLLGSHVLFLQVTATDSLVAEILIAHDTLNLGRLSWCRHSFGGGEARAARRLGGEIGGLIGAFEGEQLWGAFFVR